MRAFPLVIAAFAVAALWGCRGDRCEELPAQAQIDVELEGIAAEDVVTSEVKLTINDKQEVSRSFSKPTPSFLFKFEKGDTPPRTLVIIATVFDQHGGMLGSGRIETTFSSDGCNFFTVVVTPGSMPDAGLDGGANDAPVVDTAEPDSPIPDAPTYDLSTTDAAPDHLTADTTVDLPTPDMPLPDAPLPDVGPFCGDGVKNGSEQCEGSDLGNETCETQGFEGGTLTCKANCTIDSSDCYKCGDGLINGPTEICDGTSLGVNTCKTQGFYDGVLTCSSDCMSLDTVECHDCGNGLKNADEQCEGNDLGGSTCQSLGFEGGMIACQSDCTFDTSSCYKCGDGIKTGSDQCDGQDLGGETCASQGFDGGLLTCSQQCTLATTGCYNVLDSDGIAISTATDYQLAPEVTSNGTDYLVAWYDQRTTIQWDIYGSRVSSDGSVLDSGGIAICTATHGQSFPSVAANGTNYLVAWGDSRYTPETGIYGTRVDSTGTVLDSAGIAISTSEYSLYAPAVAFDGTNYLVTWDVRGGVDTDLYGARVSPTGSVLDSAGISISTEVGDQAWPAVAFDGTNYLVVWNDGRNGVDSDIYGARVSTSGNVLDSSGIAISTAVGDQIRPAVDFDGSNYLVVWKDDRDGADFDIYGSRVSPAGSVLDSGGIAISVAPGHQEWPAMAFDGNSYLVVWHDYRNGGTADIYGTWLSVDGNVLDSAGVAISTGASGQERPSVAFNGNDYLVVWHDYRNGSTTDIYGARLHTSGNP